jgi:23S rRNA (cytidine1920-2'-O)/16S rRNA (cytidine1409-2'-O)-methyltransferase
MFVNVLSRKTAKIRLDQLLVGRGLVESREKAQARILAGQVMVDEQKVEQSGTLVSPEARIRLLGDGLNYVGRGGLKLEHALNCFGINVRGRICLDIGASTGGFTDCLLQRGATKVFAVDVGTDQLDWRIRRDPHVVALERINARYLTFDKISTRRSGDDGRLFHLGYADPPCPSAPSRILRRPSGPRETTV